MGKLKFRLDWNPGLPTTGREGTPRPGKVPGFCFVLFLRVSAIFLDVKYKMRLEQETGVERG